MCQKSTDQHVHIYQYSLGPWEGRLTIKEGPGLESQEEGHFILHF